MLPHPPYSSELAVLPCCVDGFTERIEGCRDLSSFLECSGRDHVWWFPEMF
jgi:hypothetical protein